MRLRDRLWNPYIVVFLSSACIMVIELVASRLVAPRLGVSLYTWTSVIGVILAGISLGNYVGGRLADRFGSPPFLGLIFALASLGSLAILLLNNILGTFDLPKSIPLIVWVVVDIAGVFFLPSMILGCVSPIVVKLSLTDLQRSGTTVGKIYAWSSVGSIVGTFATGFYLISLFGTKTVVLMVAGLQMLLAVWFLSDVRGWKRATGAVAVLIALFGGTIGLLSWRNLLARECRVETNYFCVKVHDREVGNSIFRELVLDRLVHSYTDLNDPTNLQYGYEKTYAEVIRPVMQRRPTLDAFFIGGGGYTFPRYLEAMLPQSHLVVAEIDPGVTEIAHELLGLARDTRMQITNLDARIVLEMQDQPDSYDLVFGDAFNDYSVPFHLTTREFDQMVDRLLREDGLYVVNIIDGGKRGHFLRAYVRTLQQVFAHVAVIPSSRDWRDASRMTFVLVASQRPVDLSELSIPSGPTTESQVLSAEDLQTYLDQEPPLILTDEFVPVDNLLAPVFEDSHRG